MLEVLRVLVDMYSAPLINSGTQSGEMIQGLLETIKKEVEVATQLKQIGGQLEMMFRMAAALQ